MGFVPRPQAELQPAKISGSKIGGSELAPESVSIFAASDEAAKSDTPTPAEAGRVPAGGTNGYAAMEVSAASIAADPVPRQCAWEHGVVGDRGYWRCDEPAVLGRPWCEHHVRLFQVGKSRNALTLRARYG